MNTRSRVLVATSLMAAMTGSAIADDTHAGRAVNEAAQTSGHASASAAHSIAASGQVTSAVSAVPLSVGGVVLSAGGAVSAAAARDSARAATAPIGTPLKVTDEAISVVPPNEALKSKAKAATP